MRTKSSSLAAVLSENKSVLVSKWLDRTLEPYPGSAAEFLSQQPDPFRNPVGHTLREGLASLFDGLVCPAEATETQQVLDGIIRIRAVQDISASQAVAFVFLIKRIIRAELGAEAARFPDELADLEFRIDGLALLAFDLFMKCRGQIYEIRANESRRMAFLPDRTHLRESAGTK